jgi:hypothetical protein
MLSKPGKKAEMPFEGPLADRPCMLCGKKYRGHELKILDLGIEFDKVCEKYKSRKRPYGQNLDIVIKTSKEFQEYGTSPPFHSIRKSNTLRMYSWVKLSDEFQNYCKDLGELKDGGDDDHGDGDVGVVEFEEPALGEVETKPPPPVNITPPLVEKEEGAAAGTDTSKLIFKLKPNQELRFEVKADSNQQARRSTATLVLQQGSAEVCGAELAERKE